MTCDEIKSNLENIKDEIKKAELSSGRMPGQVKLLAVSKFHPVESILETLRCGQFLYGENRVQEADEKFSEIYKQYDTVDLHIIGTLQKNKIEKAVRISSCIESIDRIDMLEKIEKSCVKEGKIIEVLFEYHTGEDSKSGFLTFEEMEKAVELCSTNIFPHIIPRGFMTMAPFTDQEKVIHESFIKLRSASEKISHDFPALKLDILSMGMSHDYKIAIEEGSTEVRIGTAIFGEREKQ